MTKKPTTNRDTETRRAALSMLADGLASLSEVAELSAMSRQLIRYWATQAGVNWRAKRNDRLAREWRKRLGRGGH